MCCCCCNNRKTTQIPQFLYDEYPNIKILICQPRRLAAIGVASRVAEEQFSSVGEKVGYMVKGETRMTTQTKIMFCTYGVLLRRLQDDPTLLSLDYVILDEIHGKYHSLFQFVFPFMMICYFI